MTNPDQSLSLQPAAGARAQFVQAMREQGCPEHWTFEDDGTGGFHNHATEWAWIAWNRARVLNAATKAPAPCSGPIDKARKP